jgi:DinB superfamily
MPTTISIDEILELLEAAGPRLTTATARVAPEVLLGAPADGEWSASEVLAHMRSCADVWGDGIARVLAEDHPTIRAMNPRQWIKRTDYREQAFHPSLRAFVEQRDALLLRLRGLTPADWARDATIVGAGKPLRWTVYSYAERLAVHERAHVTQIVRIVT